MKYKTSLLVGLASLAALVGAIADTAVTDPVGYITVELAGGTAAAPGVSIVGPTLVQKIEFSGAVASVPAAKQIKLTGATFAANAFAGGKFWIELTTGTATTKGVWTDIISNTADTITTNDDLSSLITAGTTTVAIRAHQTVGSFLGATNAAGLVAGNEANNADTVVILDPVTQNQTVIYYSNDPDAPGWLDAVGDDHSGDVLAPGQGVIIRHKADAGASKKFVVTGYVKKGQTVVAAEAGNNLICPTLATGVTVANSGLSAGVTQGAESSSADTVVFYQNGAANSIFLSNDPDAPGWQNDAGAPFGNTLLPESTAFLLRNFNTPTAFNIVFPEQVVN